MAKAKFDKLNSNTSKKEVTTHADLQSEKKSPGAPRGKRKTESADAKISISLTPTQKQELEEYSGKEHRSVSSVVKLTLFEKGIISKV